MKLRPLVEESSVYELFDFAALVPPGSGRCGGPESRRNGRQVGESHMGRGRTANQSRKGGLKRELLPSYRAEGVIVSYVLGESQKQTGSWDAAC